MKLKDKLKARLAAIAGDLKALNEKMSAEDYQTNDEDEASWASLLAESNKVKAQLDRVLEVEELEQQAAQQQVVPAAARGVMPVPGPQPNTEFSSLAEFIATVARNPNDQRLANLYNEEVGANQAEQRMDTGVSGGFAVPTQFRGTLMEVSPQESVIRPRATVIPAGDPPDSAITMPALDQTGSTPDNVYGGVTVNWIGEGAAKPESDAKLREVTLTPHEVAGYVTLTDKLLRNWTASQSIIERLLRGAVLSAEDFAFLSGNGIAKPLGVINSGAAYGVNREGSNQISRADINAMTARVLMRGGMPVWIASRSVMPQLQNLRNEVGSPPSGDGALVWNPDLRDNAGNQLLGGYPIRWNERSPQLGTKGDLMLADLSYYLIKDGSGPFVAASSHVKFTENKTLIKIFWNVDGQPWLTEPFTQEGGYQVSPFVVLDVPAG